MAAEEEKMTENMPTGEQNDTESLVKEIQEEDAEIEDMLPDDLDELDSE